jgi:hypothetical protein
MKTAEYRMQTFFPIGRVRLRRTLIFLATARLSLVLPFLSAAPTNSVSAYKPLMIGTTNLVLAPSDSNFFGANSNSMNASVAAGSGGSGVATLNTLLGSLNLAVVNETGPSNGVAIAASGTTITLYLTNSQMTSVNGLLGALTGFVTNNYANVVTFASSLTVDGAFNCLSTVNGAAAAITAGSSTGSLIVATNAAVVQTLNAGNLIANTNATVTNTATVGNLNVNTNVTVAQAFSANTAAVTNTATVGALVAGTNVTASGTNFANYSRTTNTATAGLFADTAGDQFGDASGFAAFYSPTAGAFYFGASGLGTHDAAIEAGELALGSSSAGVAGSLNMSGALTVGGGITGSGAGLSGIPGSAITGPMTVLLTNGLATGTWCYYTANYTNFFGPTGFTNTCSGVTNIYGTNGVLVISGATGSFLAGTGNATASGTVTATNGFASYATNSVAAITATAWGNTNGMNGFIWLSGATNFTIFDAQSNIVVGPQSLTNLGYKVAFPIAAGGGVTNSSAVFTFHAF